MWYLAWEFQLNRASEHLVEIKGVEGYLSIEQKQELIEKVTGAVVSVEGEKVRPVIWVIVEDVNSGEWGVGGDPITTERFKQIAKGK